MIINGEISVIMACDLIHQYSFFSSDYIYLSILCDIYSDLAVCLFIIGGWAGSSDCYENCIYGLVDVRDVAEAHILTYETPASSSQRYLCCNAVLDKSAIAGILRSLYPDHVLPQRFYFPEGTGMSASILSEIQLWLTCRNYCRCIPPGPPAFEKFSTKKLQDLGFCFTPLEQTLKDTVESLKSKGLLQ